TTTHLNQAGALILVYADGSIHLNHGGTEMGQGLHIKIAQIVADVFAVPIDRVVVSATRTHKVPNTPPTAASSGTDLTGMAAYQAAISEVAVDTLAGEHKVLAVDILHDVGRSLNPAIDMGQIEGGFIQAMGWLTTEELVYDDRGRLLTHAPSTYKIPTANDRPAQMQIDIWEPGRNVEA